MTVMGDGKNRPVVYHGTHPAVDEVYEQFKRCLPQLVDPDSQTGDLEGRWVIFKDGYVYGFSSYKTYDSASQFARVMGLSDEGPFIIALVDLEEHGMHPLHLLSAALIDQEVDQRKDQLDGEEEEGDRV